MRGRLHLVLLIGMLGQLTGTAVGEAAQTRRQLSPQQQAVYEQHLTQLERVARRLLEAVPNAPQVNFILAAGEPSINAGATFGKVIVSAGMMRFVRSDDELAMILGHELAHLTLGHVSRGATNNTLVGLGGLIVDAIFPGGGVAANQVGHLFLNHFNQNQELEADRVGLRYAADAGYDPRAGVQVMRRMAVEVPESATAGFFSSHPSSVERAAVLERLADQRSRQRVAHQPVLDSPTSRPRLERDEEACRRARAYFYRAFDEADVAKKVGLYRRGLRVCPESPRAHFELADVYIQLGDMDKATAELHEVLRYDPDYPHARDRLHRLERRLSRYPQ